MICFTWRLGSTSLSFRSNEDFPHDMLAMYCDLTCWLVCRLDHSLLKSLGIFRLSLTRRIKKYDIIKYLYFMLVAISY